MWLARTKWVPQQGGFQIIVKHMQFCPKQRYNTLGTLSFCFGCERCVMCNI
jgi:hypothetical protein